MKIDSLSTNELSMRSISTFDRQKMNFIGFSYIEYFIRKHIHGKAFIFINSFTSDFESSASEVQRRHPDPSEGQTVRLNTRGWNADRCGCRQTTQSADGWSAGGKGGGNTRGEQGTVNSKQ